MSCLTGWLPWVGRSGNVGKCVIGKMQDGQGRQEVHTHGVGGIDIMKLDVRYTYTIGMKQCIPLTM